MRVDEVVFKEIGSDAERLYEILKARGQSEEIIHFDPKKMAEELKITDLQLEQALHDLYERSYLIYLTRINKETGEKVKVVQLMDEKE